MDSAKRIDIDAIKNGGDLLRIVEEARQMNEPRLLERGGEALVILLPLACAPGVRRERRLTEEDLAAFRAAAGGWDGLVDVEQFHKNNAESRRIPSRPPVKIDPQ